MREGWQGEHYLILFEGSEVAERTRLYNVASFLPGYEVVGLFGWDAFIVRDGKGRLFTVPTVPLDLRYLAPAPVVLDGTVLEGDERFRGLVKWYKQPLVFGGNPSASHNVCWIPLKAHSELVAFWNTTYQRISPGGGTD